jgi:anti-sigma regulatory factor (Ser/Thr protein kinase)
MPEEPSDDPVRQAVALVAAQLGCDEDTARQALEAVATAADETVENVALHVLDGTVRFDS